MNTKKLFAAAIGLNCVFVSLLQAQQAPTGAASTTITPWNPTNSSFAWFRGGNNAGGGAGTNNIFGTNWNSPIYTITGGVQRMWLNATYPPNAQPTINGVTGAMGLNTSGYLGLGFSGANSSLNPSTGPGPWTLLHLEGPNNTAAPGGGWRMWMKTGMLTKENSDNLYIGMKSEFNPSTGINYSDAILNWGDDGFGANGPDDMRFIFTAAAPGNGFGPNTPTNAQRLDGREIMRMIASGNVGIGPVFSKIPLGGANQPQSLLHLNIDGTNSAYLQVSSQTGTGQLGTDGTKLGIIDDGTTLLYNQENQQLLFSTAHLVPTGSGVNSDERVRIMALNAPTNLPGGGMGVYNPGALTNPDVTRVSISHDPLNPVTRPLALLHLGYNAGSIGNAASLDGWRPWMDVGTFTGQGTDNMYVGMKREASNVPLQPDRFDAVINWGDNQGPSGPLTIGPDNLRFIFTSTQTGSPNTFPANSANGVEAMRMTPSATTPSQVYVGVGGDPTTGNNYQSGNSNPTQTLEVNSVATAIGPTNSGLRFTDLNSTSATTANPGTGVLSVNAQGDVIYVPNTPGTTFGAACPAPATAAMTTDWDIPMAGFNYLFSGQGATGNRVGIGLVTCTPAAKLHVATNSGTANSLGVFSISGDVDGTGLRVRSAGLSTSTQSKVAAQFEASPGAGSQQVAVYVPQGQGVVNVGFPTSNSGQGQLINVNGTISVTSAPVITSDASVKTNVQNLSDAYSYVARLNGVQFEYLPSYINDTSMYGTHYGFIAQQVDTVLPAVVHQDFNGRKSITYTEIIPYLVEALKQEHRRNDTLQTTLAALQSQVNGCCEASARHSNESNTAQTNVELKDDQSVILDQNVPNPFAEQTTIGYFLPDNVVKAQMLFYNVEGKLINALDIQQRGKGQINVFANDLSNGVYTYTLVADGEIIASKRMVKNK